MSYNHDLNDYTGDNFGKTPKMVDEKLPKSILIIPISIILIIIALICFSLNVFGQENQYKGMINFDHNKTPCYYIEKQEDKSFQYLIVSQCNNQDIIIGVNLVNGQDIRLNIISNIDYVSLISTIMEFNSSYDFIYLTDDKNYIEEILVKNVQVEDQMKLYLYLSKQLYEKY
jgi:hypothetical protein